MEALPAGHLLALTALSGLKGTDEAAEVVAGQRYVPSAPPPKDKIPCYDPSTMQLLGYAKAMSAAEVGGGNCFSQVAATGPCKVRTHLMQRICR